MESNTSMFKKGKERFVKGFKYFYNYKQKHYFEFLDPRVGFRSSKAILNILSGVVLMAVGIPLKVFGC